MDEFNIDTIPELFENIRLVQDYYREKCLIINNDAGSEIAKIAYTDADEWHIVIDNFPNKKKYFQYNFPIKDEYQFQEDMARIGLQLKIKFKKCQYWKRKHL